MREWLAAKGWDPAYGARPLKRVIQRNLQDPLAEMILAGEVKDGDRIAISVEGNVLTFNGKAPQTAEGLYPEHDLFIQSMKLKNTLRHIMGQDLITHLGLEYYD